MNATSIAGPTFRCQLPATRTIVFKTICDEGFTLIELLVVMATVAILATLLLPALAGTKPNSQSFQCVENERQLVLAWQMYAEDNSDLLPPNDYPYLTTYATQSAANQAKMKNWVVGTMAQPFDGMDRPNVFGKSELLDPNTLLSPYQTNRSVYHCPADNFIDPSFNGVRVRSYSMNSAVGTIWNSSSAMGGGDSRPVGSPVGGGWLPGAFYNSAQNTWLTYGKMSSFSRPGPANTFVIMDENPLSINDGSLSVAAVAIPGSTYLISWPSGNHNGAAGISFADGHVLFHKWLDSRTYTPQGIISPGRGSTYPTLQSPDDSDCFYLASITSARR
jgi:prepilin-type N-terminal cleavage/methylation domain-containing protein/prepilin-type processing-associated H-X9-DG protein